MKGTDQMPRWNSRTNLITTVLAGLALAGGFTVAFAAQQVISQKGKAFSESAVTIKKGDTVMFVNDDNIDHNILSATVGNEFNLGSQAPGTSESVTFKNAGVVNVICAIHPRMKLAVTVAD